MFIIFLKCFRSLQVWCHMPVIPVTWAVEVGRPKSEVNPWKNWNPIWKKKWEEAWKGLRNGHGSSSRAPSQQVRSQSPEFKPQCWKKNKQKASDLNLLRKWHTHTHTESCFHQPAYESSNTSYMIMCLS